MFVSIHDVPSYERHLLFCSDLNARPKRRKRRRSDVPAINRTLAIHGEVVSQKTLLPAPLVCRVGVA
jgi:hypothetical protein